MNFPLQEKDLFACHLRNETDTVHDTNVRELWGSQETIAATR